MFGHVPTTRLPLIYLNLIFLTKPLFFSALQQCASSEAALNPKSIETLSSSTARAMQIEPDVRLPWSQMDAQTNNNGRRTTMINPSEIREKMKVIGSDGQPVGTVDKVEGNRIKLSKNDPAAQGQHRYIPLDSVSSVEGDAIRLRQTAQETKQQWQGGAGATGGSAGGGKR
jgi:hypothetical protein